jgi:O-antigen ligase
MDLTRSGLFGHVKGFYQCKAALAYAAILVLPLVFTLDVHTFLVNRNAGWLLLLAALIMAPGIDPSIFRPPTTHKIGMVLIAIGIFLVAWQWQIGDLWLNSQFLLYCGIAACFPITVQWFRQVGSDGLGYVFLLKLGGVLGATLLLILAIAELSAAATGGGLLVREPPIYRDSRHFNYDHVVVLALTVYFASLSKSRIEAFAWFAAGVVIGYVLMWSGGRSAIGALALFLLVAGFSKAIAWRVVFASAIALVVSLALVVLTSRAGLLFGQMGRLSEGADVVASGRLDLWAGILGVWSENWASLVFGYGPDAVRMVARAEIGYPPWVQAHSAIVQALIEFGLVGLSLVLLVIFIIARRALTVLRSSIAPRDVRVTAALLVSLGAYMLVDGIIYHAIPLIMVMILTAYLFHYEPESKAHAGESGAVPPV